MTYRVLNADRAHKNRSAILQANTSLEYNVTMSITVILTILQHRSVLLDKDATSQRDPTASISPGVGVGSDGGRNTESSTEDSAEGGHEREVATRGQHRGGVGLGRGADSVGRTY